MAWATIGETLDLTGIVVGNDNLTAAQGLIELFADTTEDASDAGNISSKNLRLLKLAVAYQAAWLTNHPDAYVTIDVSNAQQDGLGYTLAHANSTIIAPLAKRAIDRLSWKRNRNIVIRRRRNFYNEPRTNGYSSAARDDNRSDWRPLS
jgi:hypothetical protein